MSRVKRSPWVAITLLVMLVSVTPYLMGALAGQSVRSRVYPYAGTAKTLDLGLSGGSFHSLAWDLTGAATLTFQLGYGSGADEFWITPGDLGLGNANPVAAAGTAGIPVFIAVAPKARVLVTGAGTGVIVFSDS